MPRNKMNRFHIIILSWICLLSVAQGQVSIQFDQADPSEDLVAGKLAQFSIYAQPTVVALAEVALYADGEKLVEAVQVASDRWIASGIFFDRGGPWDLQVIAIDENGQEWRSGIESFEVVYAPPEVRILAPLDGFQHPVGTLLPVQLAAFDPFGLITHVELWLNGQLIVTHEWSENNFSWKVEVPNPLPNEIFAGDKPLRSNIQLISAGTYVLEARAYSTTGLYAFSERALIEVDDPVLSPVMNLISPADGSQFLPGTTVPVQVEGWDPGGLIEHVEFLMNGVVVDSLEAPPFRTNVQLPSTGQYRLQARATTSFGQFSYSQEIVLQAGPPDGVTPRVIINFPLPLGAGDTVNDVSQASDMYFNAVVTDPDGGQIEDVLFYLNGQLLGGAESQLGNTYARYYAPNSIGNYVITASAVDDSGRLGWSLPVALDVGPLERQLPQASISRDVTEAILGREVTLRAIADGGLIPVDRVDFLIDGVFIGSVAEVDSDGLYSLDWVPNEAGDFRLEARVVQIDPEDSPWDNWYITDPAVLTVSEPVGQLPSVYMDVYPVQTNLTIGSVLMVWAQAYDPEGDIQRVEFYGEDEFLGVVDGAPFAFPYTVERSGRHTLYSRVIDADGNAVSSNTIELDVSPRVVPVGPRLDLELPESVRTGEPAQFSISLSGTVLVPEAVYFFANGQLVGSSSEAPYVFDWIPSTTGQVHFFASASFAFPDGSVFALSSPIEERNIILGGGSVEEDMPPVIERFYTDLPGDFARLGQTLVWEVGASDDDGLVSIEVFRNGEPLPSNSILPIEVTDTITDMGIYRYFVRVRDTGGNITESAVREITATRGSAPLVYFVLTDSLALYEEGEPIKIEVQAVSPDEPSLIAGGKIELVEFYLNGELIGTDTIAPYEVTVEPADAALGINQLYAIAESDTGLRSQSMSQEIELKEGKLPVINSISLSPDAQVYLPETPLEVEVVVENTDTTVGVELLLFGQPIENIETPPYRFHFASETVGNYSVQARVTNVYGHSSVSDALKFSIVYPDPVIIERDFVYQTFIDLLFRIPSKEELDGYEASLLSGSLTRERFVAGLLGAGESNGHSEEYANIRTALLGWAFARSDWPQRGELKTLLEEVRTGGLSTVVARQMPAYAAAYAEDTGLVLPSQLSSDIEIEIFVGWLFFEKYGFEPDAEQLRLAVFHFRAIGRDAFVTEFISDNTVIALPEGWATARLGFLFSSDLPPVNDILQRVDAASLLINLLRVEALPSEVNSLVLELPVSQVASIISDSRYAVRFVSTFEEIEVHHEGWLRSDWFGWFNPDFEPWVFHNEQGWLRLNTTGQSENSLWYYDPSFGWIWTQSHVYPYLFDASGNRWLWTWRKPYRSGERLFFDLNTQKWLFK